MKILSAEKRAGFSLIEVNMAILVVAGGLLTLFSLFPASLRMSVTALSDTRQVLFAEDVLSQIRGNATLINNAADWDDIEKFWDNVSPTTLDLGTPTTTLPEDANEDDDFGGDSDVYYVSGTIDNYFVEAGGNSPGVPVRYCIRLVKGHLGISNKQIGTSDSTWRISIVCTDQPNSWYYDNSVYYTEVNPSF